MQPNRQLADFFRERAAWRRNVARRYNDVRSVKAADALDKLAAFVDRLNTESPTLVRLMELSVRHDRFETRRDGKAANFVRRFGLNDGAPMAAEYFLWHLADAMAEDAALPVTGQEAASYAA